MTPSEFKAWFEGFTEGLDGTPSKKQWDRICKRVSEINGTPSAPIYIERYRDRWWPTYYAYNGVPLGVTTTALGNSSVGGTTAVVAEPAVAKYLNYSTPLGAESVMFSVGKDDAAELAG